MRKAVVFVVLIALTGLVMPAAEQPDARLFALGSVGASNLYFSYLVLGTVADSYASERYTAQTARTLAEESVGLNANSRDALNELLASDMLEGADRRVVEEMVRAHELLIAQGYGLIDMIDEIDTGSEFQHYRGLAWEQISALFGPDGPEQPDEAE